MGLFGVEMVQRTEALAFASGMASGRDLAAAQAFLCGIRALSTCGGLGGPAERWGAQAVRLVSARGLRLWQRALRTPCRRMSAGGGVGATAYRGESPVRVGAPVSAGKVARGGVYGNSIWLLR